MSGHHHLWTLLDSESNVVDDDNDKSPTKTLLSPPPSPPLVVAGRKRETDEGKPGGGAECSDHEVHIWTERERRKKMRNMFSNLHALLPQLPTKADKTTIVDEAINYIKALQQTLQKFHNQKQEKLKNDNNPAVLSSKDMSTTREAFLADNDMSSSPVLLTHDNNVVDILPPPCSAAAGFQTWTSTNVVLSVCGGDAHFCVCSGKKSGLFAAVCCVLDKYQIEVVSAHVSSDFHRTFFMIQAHTSGICDEFGAAMIAEETFKQAASEIILWLSS